MAPLPHEALVSLGILLGICTKAALSCGGFMCTNNQPVVQAAEAIAFGLKDKRVEMHVQILYEGDPEDFSWVLPVPIQPELSAGSDVLFASLFDRTRPVFELTVAESSPTCTEEDLWGIACPEAAFTDSSAPSAEKLDEGSVGPFDFAIIQAADNDPTSIIRWLNEYGYEQPEGTADLLSYYATMGQKFVALRMKKDTPTGEIRPIVLSYDLPESADVLKMPFACVPIQLTSIAAVDDMPIQVYLLADARGFPLNYYEIQLDDALVDWVGCFNSPNCYINDMRARFADAAASISNHSFVTEYAGLSDIMASSIELSSADVTTLSKLSSPIDFLQALDAAGVPAITLVHTIIEKWIPKSFPESDSFCNGQPNLYTPGFWTMSNCVPNIEPPAGWEFDAEGLANELSEKVFEPAADAQLWVDSHPYLTSMYTVLSPSEMNKDPFFAFNPDLSNVTLLHSASAVPVCDDEGVTSLEITIDDGTTVTVPATQGCSGWVRTSSAQLFGTEGTPSAATHVIARNYQGEEEIVIMRSADGSFPLGPIDETTQIMDDRVVDQTVPSSDETSKVTEAASTPKPTATPTAAPVGNISKFSASPNLKRAGVIALFPLVLVVALNPVLSL